MNHSKPIGHAARLGSVALRDTAATSIHFQSKLGSRIGGSDAGSNCNIEAIKVAGRIAESAFVRQRANALALAREGGREGDGAFGCAAASRHQRGA